MSATARKRLGRRNLSASGRQPAAPTVILDPWSALKALRTRIERQALLISGRGVQDAYLPAVPNIRYHRVTAFAQTAAIHSPTANTEA